LRWHTLHRNKGLAHVFINTSLVILSSISIVYMLNVSYIGLLLRENDKKINLSMLVKIKVEVFLISFEIRDNVTIQIS
jgi:hypothetical protein